MNPKDPRDDPEALAHLMAQAYRNGADSLAERLKKRQPEGYHHHVIDEELAEMKSPSSKRVE